MANTSLSCFYRKINTVFTQTRLLLKIVLTYPVTSNEAERSFSKLKLLLSDTRTTMSISRINDLALMSTYKGLVENMSTYSIIRDYISRTRNLTDQFTMKQSIIINDSDDDFEGGFRMFFLHICIKYFFQCYNLIFSYRYLLNFHFLYKVSVGLIWYL